MDNSREFDSATGVSVAQQNGIATLSMDGRTHLNLLGPGVFRQLRDRVDECGNDRNVRAIILRGSGERAFSAGVDLREMKDLNPLTAERFIRSLHRAARILVDVPVPVVAAIQGPCLGGALELALAADIRIASADAIFGLPEVRVGLPSVIEASLLPPTVGLGRARKDAAHRRDHRRQRSAPHRSGGRGGCQQQSPRKGDGHGAGVSGHGPTRAGIPEGHRGQVAGTGRGGVGGVHHQGLRPRFRYAVPPRGHERPPQFLDRHCEARAAIRLRSSRSNWRQ